MILVSNNEDFSCIAIENGHVGGTSESNLKLSMHRGISYLLESIRLRVDTFSEIPNEFFSIVTLPYSIWVVPSICILSKRLLSLRITPTTN